MVEAVAQRQGSVKCLAQGIGGAGQAGAFFRVSGCAHVEGEPIQGTDDVALLDIPLGTVKSRLRLALARLGEVCGVLEDQGAYCRSSAG